VAGGWRRLHNEELYNLYLSPNIIRAMGWTGHIAHMGEKINAYKILVGRHRRRSNDNIRKGPREIGWENVTGFGECLLLFSPKSFVFPSHIKKTKD
jgi:hypothetical protein